MKKLICILMTALFVIFPINASATETASVYPYDIPQSSFWFATTNADYVHNSDAKGLMLMEYSTGKVLYSENDVEPLPIASVTKVFTMLLVMEAIDDGRITLGDMVTVSEYAAGMGGSQVFLEAGEQMSVEDLLKSVVVSSANDATVALAEYICGSESAFAAAMNARAAELGCKNSNFVNSNGLPAENHYSCALDVALATRELMKHEKIFDYTKIWMDTIRNGTFGLANTNKLIRYYNGATGMKTGYTDEALYCLSGTAERDGLKLIAVVLGASTSDIRFSAAKSMLDYGFANYSVVTPESPSLEPLSVVRGVEPNVQLQVEKINVLLSKKSKGNIEHKAFIQENIQAPAQEGTNVGYVAYYVDGAEVARANVTLAESVEEVSYLSLLKEIFGKLFFRK